MKAASVVKMSFIICRSIGLSSTNFYKSLKFCFNQGRDEFFLYEGETKDNVRTGYGVLYYIEEDYREKIEYLIKTNRNLGTISYKKHKIYEGSWYHDEFYGEGSLYDGLNNKIYDANWMYGDLEGEVLEYLNGKIIYKGECSRGNYHGQGVLFFQNGINKYNGNWLFGQYDGYGKEYYHNGVIKYEGSHKRNLYQGFGEIYYQNGLLQYKGNWSNGLYDGLGTQNSDEEKHIYSGEFLQGKFHGKGVYTKGSISYIGMFENGKFNGNEKIALNGVWRYEGEWKDNKQEGNGISYFENGKYHYEGSWKNGVMDGQGILFNEVGSIIYKGNFRNGKRSQ